MVGRVCTGAPGGSAQASPCPGYRRDSSALEDRAAIAAGVHRPGAAQGGVEEEEEETPPPPGRGRRKPRRRFYRRGGGAAACAARSHAGPGAALRHRPLAAAVGAAP